MHKHHTDALYRSAARLVARALAVIAVGLRPMAPDTAAACAGALNVASADIGLAMLEADWLMAEIAFQKAS